MKYLNNGFDDDYGDDEENPYEDWIDHPEPNEEQRMAHLLDTYIKCSLDAYNCLEANRSYIIDEEGGLTVKVSGFDGTYIRGFTFSPDWELNYWKSE